MAQVTEARALLGRALALGRGPYTLQAAISSLHADEPVDWPELALELVDRLELENYQYLHSTRADLLRRLGRIDEARGAYRCALELAQAGPERRFLEHRIAGLSGHGG